MKKYFFISVFLPLIFTSAGFAVEVRRIENALALPLAKDPKDADGLDVEMMKFSPTDPHLVAIAGHTQALMLVDIDALQMYWRKDFIFNFSHYLEFSHDGRLIATAHQHDVYILDTFSGDVRQQFKPMVDGVYQSWVAGQPIFIRWTKDDASLLINTESYVLLIDRVSGKTLWSISLQELGGFGFSYIKDLQISPDDRFGYLFTGTDVIVIDLVHGKKVRSSSLLAVFGDDFQHLDNFRVTSDGSYALASAGMFVYIVDILKQQLVRRLFASSDRLNDLSLTSDQCCILTASNDGTSRLYDIASGQQITRLDDTRPSNQRVWLRAVAAPRQSDVIVTADYHGILRIWRP